MCFFAHVVDTAWIPLPGSEISEGVYDYKDILRVNTSVVEITGSLGMKN